MSDYQPERREVRCRLLLDYEWIEGTFLIPVIRNFLEHLETMHEFQPLVNVTFLGSGHHENFFDVNRATIRLVLPPENEAKPAIPVPESKEVEHDVFCLLPGGHLHGRLRTRKGLRTSDYFRPHHSFVTLRDCRFVPRDLSSEQDESEAYPVVCVHARHVLGVSEPAGPVKGA